MNKPFLTIVMPAHNEGLRIEPTLEEYAQFFRNKVNSGDIEKFEIIVVLNGCKDNTLEIVKKAAEKHREIRWLEFQTAAKGFAVIEGFKAAEGELVGFVDADMATPPEAYFDLVSNLEGHDGIIASRYIKGAIVDPKPIMQRIFVSRMFNFLIRSLFFMPYRDTQCGAKIFKREAIARILQEIIITRWAFDVDLLYRLEKYNFRIREFPTVWRDKKYSHINFKRAGPLMALAAIRLRIVNSPFRGFMRLYDNLPAGLKIYRKLLN